MKNNIFQGYVRKRLNMGAWVDVSDPHLNISELGDFDVSRPALRQQEEPALGHGDLAHAVAGLDGWRELVDTFVGLQVLQHDGR